jgi:ribonuclease HI
VEKTAKRVLRCYVDGSWSPKSINPNLAGWGIVFEDGATISGTVPHRGMRQIAGECEAVLMAIAHAIKNGAGKLVIFYDYQGLREWAMGSWKARTPVTIRYRKAFTERLPKYDLEVRFVKVNPEKNRADKVATAAIGIKSVH